MMDVIENTLQGILDGSKQYLIPHYQRKYAWGAKNWNALWNDIVELAGDRKVTPTSSHFTGTLVLDASAVTTGLIQFVVVDGQQRLTTLSTLVAAIAKKYEDSGDLLNAERLRNQVLFNQYATQPEGRYKLRPANFDEEIFRSAVDGNIKQSPDSNIDDAFGWFSKKLNKLVESDLTLAEFENAVLLGLKFVTITAKQDDNAFRIFESINNTGIALSQADLIRNLVFMRMGDNGQFINESIWKPMQAGLETDDVEYAFWIDAQFRNPEVKKYDVYEVQKKHIKTLDEQGLIDYLKNVVLIAEALKKLKGKTHDSDSGIQEVISQLAELELPSALVMMVKILYLREKATITRDDALGALKVILSYLVRRSLAAVPISSLGNLSAFAAHAVSGDARNSIHNYLSTGKRKYQTDAEIEKLFLESDAYNRSRKLKVILTWLLKVEQNQEVVDFTEMTIEHILPQSLKPKGIEEFGALLQPGQSVDEVHESVVHTIGNLTLTNYNPQLSNEPFSVKRATWLNKTGVLANVAISQLEQWGPGEIRSRALKLAQLVGVLFEGPNEALLEVEPASLESRLAEVITLIPAGRWTTYGEVAQVVGTNSQSVGNGVTKYEIEGAWRILKAGGYLASGFTWSPSSPYFGTDPKTVLMMEGVRFDANSQAHIDYHIGAEELRERLGESE